MTTRSDGVSRSRLGNQYRSGIRILAPLPRCPAVEPPGPRSIALAMVDLGLVTGGSREWQIEGVLPGAAHSVRYALCALLREGAVAERAGRTVLTAHGRRLLGPDLRQRGFLSVT